MQRAELQKKSIADLPETHARKGTAIMPAAAAESHSRRPSITDIDKSPHQLAQQQLIHDVRNSPRAVAQRRKLDRQFGSAGLSADALSSAARGTNRTGLPDVLKSGVEQLSGMPLDDVKVHYNSSRPAQLNAHAYAQGREIHVAPGQERHLPHEAWHVVQQAQGRVQATRQMMADKTGSGQAPLQLYSAEEEQILKGQLLGIENNEGLADWIIGIAPALGDHVANMVSRLAASGKLHNITGLAKLLEQIRAALDGGKDMEEKIRNAGGYIWELQYALWATEHPDVALVQLGAVGQMGHAVGGDLVTRSTGGAIETAQIKLVTGAAKKVKENIRKGIRQLGGEGGETADPTGRRVVDVTVTNKENALAAMSEDARVAELKQYIFGVDTTNVDRVFVHLWMPDGKVRNYSFDAKDQHAAPIVT